MQGLGQYVVKVWIISDHMFGNRRAALCTAHGPGDDDWNATGSAQGRSAELTHGREGVVRLGCRRRTRQALPQEEEQLSHRSKKVETVLCTFSDKQKKFLDRCSRPSVPLPENALFGLCCLTWAVRSFTRAPISVMARRTLPSHPRTQGRF